MVPGILAHGFDVGDVRLDSSPNHGAFLGPRSKEVRDAGLPIAEAVAACVAIGAFATSCVSFSWDAQVWAGQNILLTLQ